MVMLLLDCFVLVLSFWMILILFSVMFVNFFLGIVNLIVIFLFDLVGMVMICDFESVVLMLNFKELLVLVFVWL